MKYNKLVRDKIPGIIKNAGKTAKIHVANEKEFSEKINEKLKEEVNEFLVSKNPEEILDAKRERKAEIRGKFTKRIILDGS